MIIPVSPGLLFVFLTDCMAFNAFYFNNITAASAPIHAIIEFSLLVINTILFVSHWLLSDIAIIETMLSCERGVNLGAMSSICPRREIGLAMDQTNDLLFSSLLIGHCRSKVRQHYLILIYTVRNRSVVLSSLRGKSCAVVT